MILFFCLMSEITPSNSLLLFIEDNKVACHRIVHEVMLTRS